MGIGGCGGMRPAAALLCVLVLTLIAEVFTESHICHKIETVDTNVTKKCSNFMVLTFDGYSLDRQESNLTGITENDLEKKLIQWSIDPESSPDCVFVIKTETNVTSCCGGWTGPDCDTPVCKPDCLNGGSCVDPGSCSCPPHYVGLACEDNTLAVTNKLKYCYLRTSCFGDKVENGSDVMTKDDCCGLNGHGWGLTGNSCVSCFKFQKDYLEPSKFTPDQPNVAPSLHYLSYQTCMGFGPNYWRTFDGLEFLFPGRCKYILMDDGYHRVTARMITCHSYAHCTKELTLTFGTDVEIIVQGSTISVSGVTVSVTLNQAFMSLSKGIRIEKRGDYFWLEHGTLRLRWDTKNTFFLTMEESETSMNVSNIVGLCGNNNGNPYDDMKTPSFESVSDPTKLGNSWIVDDQDAPCVESPSVTYTCLNSQDETEAIDACGALWLEPFSQCHDTVVVNHYFIRCVNDHCTAKAEGVWANRTKDEMDAEIEAALCQTLTAYGQICNAHNVSFEWRTEELCALKCPPGMQYGECWPRCLKTCSSLYSPRSVDCDDKRCYPGCSCPTGWFYTDDKCVPAEQCPCTYQGKIYQADSTINIDCNQCKCKAGRWNCTDRPCGKVCSVISYQHITTFDGKDYEFHGPECLYTLVELRNDEYWGAAIFSRGDLSISYSQIKCLTRRDISCIGSVHVNYRHGSNNYDVIIERSRVITVNGFILTDPTNQAYVTDDIYVKQMTSLFIIIQGFGYKVLFDPNGKLYVQLDPFFNSKVRGLCGNMDGSITNEFSSRSNIIEQLLPFVKSFSDCSLTWPEETTLELIDACVRKSPNFDPKIPFAAANRCKQISKPKGVFEECLKVVDWKQFEDFCIRDVCANPNSPDAFCNIVSGLAYKCLSVGFKVDWMKDYELESTCKGVYGYGCPPRSNQEYSDCTTKVTKCRDMQFSNPIPDDDYCIPGCNCIDGKLLNDHGQCVQLSDCTCYDRYTGKVYNNGEKSLQFQSECVCKNGDWQCKNGTIEIRCPFNQVYQRNTTTCGSTCSTYDFRQQCPKDTQTNINGCGCPPTTVMLPNGTCVDPDECPCTFDGQMHDPNATVSIGCVDYFCTKRQWTVLSERNCKTRCLSYGDPHYITFDKYQYSFQGLCEYTLVKYEHLFQVTAGNVPCGTTGVTCSKIIKAKVNGTEVKLLGGMNTTINGVEMMRSPQIRFPGGVVIHTDFYTIVSFYLGMDIYSDGGTTVIIALSTAYSGQVGGLCGNFDGIYGNDLVDLISGQPSGTIAEFTSRWKTVENCPDTKLPEKFDPCESNPKRLAWAQESCAIIREGELFEKCRKKIGTAEYFYKMCLFDSCGCDLGGDCKCFCTVVAAFARECALVGECVRWRSHDLCPDMCDNGKVYQSCAEPCKKTCSNFALKQEPFCKQSDLVEGCFCPKDYVEDDNGDCVPISKCPCSYSAGSGSDVQLFPAGTSMTIDCQTCTCSNATFVCQGQLCPPCLVDQFSCASGDKCIPKHEACDAIFDCPDKSDEYPLNPSCGPPTCSPLQFTCASGKMCVPQWSICDGHLDCQDGSDEHNCEPICEPGYFRCDNYRCILPAFVCDGKYDCGPNDVSDEKHCTTTRAPCLYVDYYRCVNDECIPRHMTCDGHDDCGDESDELDCYDCDGRLDVVDKLSPELKVEPAELRSIFQSPNHTDPVKVIPTTVITIQLLVPNSYIVSFHMWVDYIKEIQLVFYDKEGNPIKNGTHQWTSTLEPGSDIAVMQFKREVSSNIVKVSMKPFPGQTTETMLIKAITVRSCNELVPNICPVGYTPIEYQYSGYGSKEFRTTINDNLDGSNILEGSAKDVVVKLNDFVAITRTIPSETFILMNLRLVAANVTTAFFTFTDANNRSQSEGLYPSNNEIVYHMGVGLLTELLRVSITFKSRMEEIHVGKLNMKGCILKAIKDCDRPTLIDYNSRRTTRVFVLNADIYQFTDAWSSMLNSPVQRWNMTVDLDQTYQYIMEFQSQCESTPQVRTLSFTIEGVYEFQVTIGDEVLLTEKNVGRKPYTYSSEVSQPGDSVTVTFKPRDDVILIYDAEVGVCCWNDHTTLPPTTTGAVLTTKLPPATTISHALTATATPISAVTKKPGCEMDIDFNYRRAKQLTVSILNATGYPVSNPKNILRYSPAPGRWSASPRAGDSFCIRLNIKERCIGHWEISCVSLAVEKVRQVEMKLRSRNLYSWNFANPLNKNTVVQKMNLVSDEIDVCVHVSDKMSYISGMELEARCCSNDTSSTTMMSWTELSASKLQTTLNSESVSTTEQVSHTGTTPTAALISQFTSEATTYEHLTTTELPCPCETMPLVYGSHLRFDISGKDEAGAVLPGVAQALLGSPNGFFSTRTTSGSKYYISLNITETCINAWKIANIHVTVKGALKVEVFAGDVELRSWDKLVPTSGARLVATPCVLSNGLLFVVEASGGNLQISNLFLDLCTCLTETTIETTETTKTETSILTAFTPETIETTTTTKTETSTLTAFTSGTNTSGPCDKSLLVDYNTYMQDSFKIRMKSDDGTPYPGAWQALRYSGNNGLVIMAEEDQMFTMSFTLENCNGTWKISTIGFNTTHSKQVQLKVEERVEETWSFIDNLKMNDVSTDFTPQLEMTGDEFQLVFNSTKGRLVIADLFIDLFCSCGHNIILPSKVYESSTLTIPTHSMPVTSLHPTTVTYNTELKPNEKCDESLLINDNTYQKSFNMTMKDVDGAKYRDAFQALRDNVVNGWKTMALKDELYIMNFTLLDICSDNWEIVTINVRTTYVTKVELVVGEMWNNTWTFADSTEMNRVNNVVGKSVVGDVFHIIFTAAGGNLRIDDLFMELVCNCTHETSTLTIPTHSMPETSTLTIPTHSMPVTYLHPTTVTYNTELKPNETCDESLLIDYNTYQKSFNMTMKDVDGVIYRDAFQALRDSVVNGWKTMALKDELYIMNFTLVDICSDNWEIVTINVRTTYVTKVELVVGEMANNTWTFEHYTEMNKISTPVGKSVVGDVFHLIFTAAGGNLRIDDLFMELFCNCTHETSTLTIPTHSIPESSTSTIPTHSIPVTSLHPTTITYNTELKPNETCDESLLINYNTYQKSFNMTMKDVDGAIYRDAFQALRYSVGNGWQTMALKDELYIMNFTLLDKCSDNWEITTIHLRTTYATEVLLYVGKMENNTWTFVDSTEVNQVSTVVGKSVVGDNFHLIFKAAGGNLRIDDLFIELFCNCTHVTSLPPRTITYSIPTHTIPVTTLHPTTITHNTESSTLTNPTHSMPETTTSVPCDKGLLVDYKTYQDSFEMRMKSDDGTLYPGAWQALRYSGNNGLTIMAEEEQIFNMSFILKNCNGSWKINTIGFNTTHSKQVQLKVEEKVEYTWSFYDFFKVNEGVSTVFTTQLQLPGDQFQLVFNSTKGRLVISDLFIDLFCSCGHDIIVPSKVYESSTVTTPTHSMPVTSLPPRTITYNTELKTNQPCDESLLIDNNTYKKSFEMTMVDVDKTPYLDAMLALRYSVGNGWQTMAPKGALYYMKFVVLDICSDNWEIGTVSLRTTYATQVQLEAGNMMQAWIFKNYAEMNRVNTAVRKSLVRNDFQLVFKAAGGMLHIEDLSIELLCNCTHESSTLTTPTHSMPVTSLPPIKITHNKVTSLPPITITHSQESTTNKPCDESLPIDYNTYNKSFEMTMQSDDGTIHSDAIQALRDSVDNGWNTNAREDELFVMNFTLLDVCSDNWELLTINLRTIFIKKVHLEAENIKNYTWILGDNFEMNTVNTVVGKTLSRNGFQLLFEAAGGQFHINDLFIELFCNCTNETATVTIPTHSMPGTASKVTSLPPETTTYKTETATLTVPTHSNKACDKRLQIDNYNYEKSFELTMKSDDGTIHSDAWKALRYKEGGGWWNVSSEDQFVIMEFTLLDNCSSNWETSTINVWTTAKEIQLVGGNMENSTWKFSNMTELHELITDVKKTVDRNTFQLIFKAGTYGTFFIDDLYMELFCNCTHETATLTVSTHSMPVTSLPRTAMTHKTETATVTVPTHSMPESTTNKPCDKNLLIDNNNYQKSFEMTMESDSGTIYSNVSQALRYSAGNGWRKSSQNDELFTMEFALLDTCSDNWTISTVNFRTNAKQVELGGGNMENYTWTFDEISKVNQVTTHIRRTVTGSVIELIFKSFYGSILIEDLQMELFCNCTHETSTLTIPTHSEPVSYLPRTTTTHKTESTTNKPCDQNLLIDYNNYQKSFEMTIENDSGTIHSNVSQALRYSAGNGWRTGSQYYELFIMEFTLLENCSGNWEISTINFRTVAKQVELGGGNMENYTWIFEEIFKVNQVTTDVRKTVTGSVFRLIFKSFYGSILIEDLNMELFCNCTHETSTLTIPTHSEPVTSLPRTTSTYKTESTTNKPCDKDLVIDYIAYNKSFEMMMTRDDGTIYSDSWQALRYGAVNGWRKVSRDEQLFTLQFALLDNCSDNWEISTINFRTNAKQVELGGINMENYTWIFNDISQINQVTTDVRKTFTGSVLSLVFTGTYGSLLINDFYMELFCNCTHETATLNVPTHSLPVTSLPRTTMTYKTESTTSKPCDKNLVIDYIAYNKSFEMIMTREDEEMKYSDAWQALRYSATNGWRKASREDQIFILEFTLLDTCSGKWEISTINFRTTAKQIQLGGGNMENYPLAPEIFNEISRISQVTTDVRKTFDGNFFQLMFTSTYGTLFIDELYMGLFCNCTHETSSAPFPTHSMPETALPLTLTTYKTGSTRSTTPVIRGDTEVSTAANQRTTELPPLPCLATQYINNDTYAQLNVSMVLLNSSGENVADASPAFGNERWNVPYAVYNSYALQLEIWETCINPKILSLKFTVEGVYILSVLVDNEPILSKRIIPNGGFTIIEQLGTFSGSQITLNIDLHNVEYFVYGFEVDVCCEHCPNAFIIDYSQSPTKNFAIDLTDETGEVVMNARKSLLHGPGLSVPVEISQTFSIVAKILEHCSTTWYYRSYQFGLDWAAAFKVRVGSKTIANSKDFVLEDKYFTEKNGFFAGSDFELFIEQHLTPVNPILIYDLKLVACCGELATGTTLELTTGTVEWTTKTGGHTSKMAVNMTAATITNHHLSETVSNTPPMISSGHTSVLDKTTKLTSLLTTATFPSTSLVNTTMTTEQMNETNAEGNTSTPLFTQTSQSLPTTGWRYLQTACALKPTSMQILLRDLKVNCRLIDDFDIMICDGVCSNRRVATVDFDYRRVGGPEACECCNGDGEVRTVIVKCFDVGQKDHYTGEHSITYMEYNKCECTKCGLQSMDGTGTGGF